MGTILKYIFYIALIIIIYLVGKGIFEGNITETTTVGQVVDDVKSGASNMASDVADKTKEAVGDVQQNNNVQSAPKANSNQGALNSTQGEYKMSENTISDKAGKAWDKTKEASSDAWDATKETAGDAWDATKEGAQKAGDAISEKSGDAWDATKEASGKAWDKTKEVSSDAWEATKEGAQNVKDKVTGETNDAAYQAHQKTNNAQHENRAGY